MSEVNKMAAKTVEIKNYTVPVRYFTRAVLKGGRVVEQEVEEEIEVGMLSRTSVAHTKFAGELLQGGMGDPTVSGAVAVKFASMMIIDDKKRAAISQDQMACLDLFWSDPVQKDIERFLSTWGIVERMISNAPEDTMSRSENE